MSTIKNCIKFLKNPLLLFMSIGQREYLNWLDDKTYLKIAYRVSMGKKLNLENPVKYTEKLQWLKLYNRDPRYVLLVDKYEVKSLVAKAIGAEYVIPTIGVWNTVDEIDFSALPDKFVLKTTHNSGGNIICKDKSNLNIEMAKRKLKKYLQKNFYYGQREWPYKNIRPRIIAEPYLEDEIYGELRDYKFFSFDGEVKYMFIATERDSSEETKFDFYDIEFNHLDIINGHPNAKVMPTKPKNLDKMIKLTQILSKDMPHVRVDFYEVNGRVYFGEMTFFHWSGFKPFYPEKWDKIFGDCIKLDKILLNEE